MQMTMLLSKPGCALQPNISFLSLFCKTVIFGACGNLGVVKYQLYTVHYYSKTFLFLPLPVVSTPLTNVGSLKLGKLQVWI